MPLKLAAHVGLVHFPDMRNRTVLLRTLKLIMGFFQGRCTGASQRSTPEGGAHDTHPLLWPSAILFFFSAPCQCPGASALVSKSESKNSPAGVDTCIHGNRSLTING